ncbi:hypothetical protein HPB48_010654 [Haemaphysalis longicornis]|uniref:Uncharacterized protein n=1 Tax=Haemaphysalis longicornis TaxID=44386 RepID=A0A9J6GVX5_HAELO|nr:hypothetical protein HPB48_010654 [Haemaphysalis longicornis]
MECKLPNAKRAIKAGCILHNICEDLGDTVEQQWEKEARAIDTLCQPTHSTGMCGQRGPEVPAALADYFWKPAHRASYGRNATCPPYPCRFVHMHRVNGPRVKLESSLKATSQLYSLTLLQCTRQLMVL